MSISLKEFEKASLKLKGALNQEKNEFIRDSVIQRFEFCVELAWKTSKKIMGTSTTAPKQVIREMAQNKIIENIDQWLMAIDKRNLSSHSYNEQLAEEIYDFALTFYPEIEKLVKKLGEM